MAPNKAVVLPRKPGTCPEKKIQKNKQTGFTHSLARHTHKNQTKTQNGALVFVLPPILPDKGTLDIDA